MTAHNRDAWGRRIDRLLGRRKWPGYLLYFLCWGVWVVALFLVGGWYLAVPLAVIVLFSHWYKPS